MILQLTQKMLEAARSAQWDALVELERDRDDKMQNMKDATFEAQILEHPQEAKVFMEKILKYDEEIKYLTEDWMRELRDILGSITAQKKLERTYGAANSNH